MLMGESENESVTERRLMKRVVQRKWARVCGYWEWEWDKRKI